MTEKIPKIIEERAEILADRIKKHMEKTWLEKLEDFAIEYFPFVARKWYLKGRKETCEAILKDDKEERSPRKEHIHCYCYERLIENINKGIK